MKKNILISLATVLFVFLFSCKEKTDIFTENNGYSFFLFDTTVFWVEAVDYTIDGESFSNFDLEFTDGDFNSFVLSIYTSGITDDIETGTYNFSDVESQPFTFYSDLSFYHGESEEDDESFTDGFLEITNNGEDSYTVYLELTLAGGDSLSLNYSGDIPITFDNE